jgi:hypothetical protein
MALVGSLLWKKYPVAPGRGPCSGAGFPICTGYVCVRCAISCKTTLLAANGVNCSGWTVKRALAECMLRNYCRRETSSLQSFLEGSIKLSSRRRPRSKVAFLGRRRANHVQKVRRYRLKSTSFLGFPELNILTVVQLGPLAIYRADWNSSLLRWDRSLRAMKRESRLGNSTRHRPMHPSTPPRTACSRGACGLGSTPLQLLLFR